MTANGSHHIHLFKEQQDISCAESSTILEATLAAKINHVHACGGHGKCSTCRISVMEGIEHFNQRNEAEQQMADRLSFPAEIRLACQATINGDVAIRRMVSDSVDMDMITEQFTDDSSVVLGTQQELTIVFTDIENYTSLAERFPPYDIVHVLSRYYRMMNTIIMEHDGIISDVAGDGILAVFGTEKKTDNSVLDAVKAIERMRKRLDVFNEYLEGNFNLRFGFRAGVHLGSVIVGPFDTGSMRKLAVIGDDVNYASRIESANKEFGTNLLLSAEAYERVEAQFPEVNVFETALKGKTGKYKLYEPVS